MIGFDGGCARFRRDISLERDGCLSERRAAKLQEHLASCESCRVARDLTMLLGVEMDVAPDTEASPGFDDRVIGALFAEKREKRTNWLQWKNFAVGTAAAGLLMGFALQYAAAGETANRLTAPPSSAVKAPPSPRLQPTDLEPHGTDRNAPLWRIGPGDRLKQEPTIETSGIGRRSG